MVFLLDYPPSTNRLWRHGKHGVVYQASDVVAWKKRAAWTARATAGVRMLTGAVQMAITLHPKMTRAGAPSKRRMDADNALKVTLDAFNGIVYQDDKQITEIKIMVGDAMPNGGLTVCVQEISGKAENFRKG